MVAKQRLVRFFAHRTLSRDCPTGLESEAHVLLKLALRDAAVAAGWQATVEFGSNRLGPQQDGDRWIADVLVTSPGHQPVALEAQLARQGVFEAKERTERYLRNSVDVIWFTRRRSGWSRRVPCVAVSEDYLTVTDGLLRLNKPATAFEPATTTLQTFVGAYLRGQITTIEDSRLVPAYVSKAGVARHAEAIDLREAASARLAQAEEEARERASQRRVLESLTGSPDDLHVTSALFMRALSRGGIAVGRREHHGDVDLIWAQTYPPAVVAVGGPHPDADFIVHIADDPPRSLPPGEACVNSESTRLAVGDPCFSRQLPEINLAKLLQQRRRTQTPDAR